MNQPPTPAAPAPKKKTPVWAWVLGAIALVLLLGFGGCLAMCGGAYYWAKPKGVQLYVGRYPDAPLNDNHCPKRIKYTDPNGKVVESSVQWGWFSEELDYKPGTKVRFETWADDCSANSSCSMTYKGKSFGKREVFDDSHSAVCEGVVPND